MAIIFTIAAATINILMACYNVAKDVVGLSKRKNRYAENLETYKDSLEWKRESLHRTRVGARRKADRFGTETVRLHNHWGERADKTDEKVGEFLAKCKKAKSFRKRAQLGEKGSALAKEVDRVEADGKIFYDPSYRSRPKAQPRFASGKDTTTMTSSSSLTTENSTHSGSSSTRSYMPAIRETGSSRATSEELISRLCSYGPCSTAAVTRSYMPASSSRAANEEMISRLCSYGPWSTAAVTGSSARGAVGVSTRYH